MLSNVSSRPASDLQDRPVAVVQALRTDLKKREETIGDDLLGTFAEPGPAVCSSTVLNAKVRAWAIAGPETAANAKVRHRRRKFARTVTTFSPKRLRVSSAASAGGPGPRTQIALIQIAGIDTEQSLPHSDGCSRPSGQPNPRTPERIRPSTDSPVWRSRITLSMSARRSRRADVLRQMRSLSDSHRRSARAMFHRCIHGLRGIHLAIPSGGSPCRQSTQEN